MKIALLTEISTVARNPLIETILSGRGHEVHNLGMHHPDEPELNYLHIATLTGWLLNAGAVDFVVGGCGTGQGFSIVANHFPKVYCGHIVEPIDAFLFSQINNGNAVSLQLNQNFGWAADYQLRLIFDQLFAAQWGGGYPAERRIPQQQIRALLPSVADACHPSMSDIISTMPPSHVAHCARVPKVLDLLHASPQADSPWVQTIAHAASV